MIGAGSHGEVSVINETGTENRPPVEDLAGIVAIQLGQNLVGEENAVDHPEPLAVMTCGWIKVFIIGLEEAKVHAVGASVGRRVAAEEDAVLILDQEPPRGIRLTAQFRDPRA